MKFEMDEIKRLANVINIEFSNDELKQVEESLQTLTSKLDELLEVDVDVEAKYSGNDLENVFAKDEDSEESTDFLNNVNNFDGEYINVKKVIEDE